MPEVLKPTIEFYLQNLLAALKQNMEQTALINYAKNFIAINEEEAKLFLSCFKLVHVKKKQFIVQPGFTNQFRSFVVKGAFRTYMVNELGEENTLQFAIENWWVSDFNSYIYQEPATLFIVALEDCITLQIDFEKEKELKQNHHKFETFFRIMAEKGLAFEHRRILFDLTHSAEERYENFIINYPNFVQRVPQYALASYLGMTPEFLSRIRKRKVKS